MFSFIGAQVDGKFGLMTTRSESVPAASVIESAAPSGSLFD
jgi:hypothetical protein